MKNWFSRNIKGDKAIWVCVIFFAVCSLLAVYSASTNLAYVVGKGSVAGYFFKQFILIAIGFIVIYVTHKIPFHLFRVIARFGLGLSCVLLLFTAVKRTSIAGVNASRWISFGGISFQPSNLALVMLMACVASYLARKYNNHKSFKESLIPLWGPVVGVVGLIVFSNLSTAILVVFSVGIMTFIGRYPMKYLAIISFAGIVSLVVFFFFARAFPEYMPSRFETWVSRIETFTGNDEKRNDDYQIERSKMAIAKGGIFGQGPGKSMMKNFLPESSSDFIYAIITEEYGLLGAFVVMFSFLFLLWRIVMVSYRAKTIYGQLLTAAVGFPIIFQALINMGVAVEIIPVTGQNLPLISSGGTSILMTSLAIGMVLSVSASKRTNNAMEEDKQIADIEEEIAEGIIKEISKNNK